MRAPRLGESHFPLELAPTENPKTGTRVPWDLLRVRSIGSTEQAEQQSSKAAEHRISCRFATCYGYLALDHLQRASLSLSYSPLYLCIASRCSLNNPSSVYLTHSSACPLTSHSTPSERKRFSLRNCNSRLNTQLDAIYMSLSHFRSSLSFQKMDNHFPTAHPHHRPPPLHTGPPRRSSITGRNPVQRIGEISLAYCDRTPAYHPVGNRRASVRSSARLSPLPHLVTESSQPTYSITSIESEDPLNYSSGFYNDDDEDEGYPPSSFHYTSRYPVIRRCVSIRSCSSPT